jgi:hypothetical protein
MENPREADGFSNDGLLASERIRSPARGIRLGPKHVATEEKRSVMGCEKRLQLAQYEPLLESRAA